ncbi:helicase-associated domain-containing protein [Cellulomonas soli]
MPALGRAVALDPSIRRTVLLAAIRATSPNGGTSEQGARALADPTALGEVFWWDDPGADVDEEELAVLWREATSWGLVALEAVTATGRALVAGDDKALLAALGAALPDVAGTLRIGSDLTAVVVGIPSAEVTDLLDLLAARESRGAASTWRLSADTVRRAFDAGLDAAEVLDRLRKHAGTVPQPVEYLVRDVGRRYGQVAVRPASAVLVVEDDGLRAELLAARSLRALHLVPVWGAVLASSATRAEVLAALRVGHYLPVEQDADGVVVIAPTARAHAAGPERRPRVREWAARVLAETGGDPLAGLVAHTVDERVPEPAVEPVVAVVARLLDGGPPPDDDELDTVLAQVERHARRLTALESRYLAWAVRHDGSVVIDYESATGSETVRRLSELELIGPHLSAWCHLRQDERYFRLDAIRAVASG